MHLRTEQHWVRWRSSPAVAAALTLMWSLSFVVTKIGLRDSGPLWFAAGRAWVAAVAMVPWLPAVRPWRLRDHLVAVSLGATNVAGLFGLQVAGLDRTEAGSAAAIIYVQPLLVIAGARFLLGERIGRRRLLGAGLALAGVAVVGIREASFGSPIGLALLLGAAGSWALGTIVLKVWSGRPLLPLIAAQNVYGAPPLILLAGLLESPPHTSVRFLLSVLYLGVFASAAGWLLLALLLRQGEAAVVSSYIFFVPMLGALFGVLLLDEPLRPSLALGAVLVGLGVRLVAVAPRSPT